MLEEITSFGITNAIQAASGIALVFMVWDIRKMVEAMLAEDLDPQPNNIRDYYSVRKDK